MKSGFQYFFEGVSLINTKGLKRFVLIPLAINLILFSVAFYFLYGEINEWINWVVNLVPDWLGLVRDYIHYLLWPIAIISVLLVFALLFGTLANWIAAPFNGLLAEKVEQHLTGKVPHQDQALGLLKDTPRALKREWMKLIYYLPRAIGFLLLFFLLPVIGQLLWFGFSAWMMAIQYCDYPYDNHKISFTEMRQRLSDHKLDSMSFGITVCLFSMIPIVNFIVMPIAVCGATAMWVERLEPSE
jgi:CysZ protein